MKDFLKNKQKWIVGLVLLGLMFVAGGFGVASYLYGNRCYRGYEVKNKVNRSDSNLSLIHISCLFVLRNERNRKNDGCQNFCKGSKL